MDIRYVRLILAFNSGNDTQSGQTHKSRHFMAAAGDRTNAYLGVKCKM